MVKMLLNMFMGIFWQHFVKKRPKQSENVAVQAVVICLGKPFRSRLSVAVSVVSPKSLYKAALNTECLTQKQRKNRCLCRPFRAYTDRLVSFSMKNTDAIPIHFFQNL